MADILMQKIDKVGNRLLTVDTINTIKIFTGELEYRNGKYSKIRRIPKTDFRYEMLLQRPKIKQILNTNTNYSNPYHNLKGSVWFKVNDKFMVFNVGFQTIWMGTHYYNGYVTEIHYNKKKSVTFIY